MDIAIKYEKINLGSFKYVFKPIGLIKGSYEEETNMFYTDYGEACNPMDDVYCDNDHFGSLITMDKLKEVYKDLSETEMLEQYYEDCSEYFYLGCLHFEEGTILITTISAADLCEQFDLYDLDSEPTEDEIKDKVEQLEKEQSMKLKQEESKKITLKELRDEVKSVIIGQDKAVEDITRAIVVNQASSNPKHKSHMLIVGPSGTGKTEMVNIIAKKLGIPYFKADATAYTKEGYVGKSVYSMLNGLITAADGDVKQAENGILIIDEIDKKLSSNTDDVGGLDVLYSMLKMMDRDIVEVDRGYGFQQVQILFDTSNLTIILMGAFTDLYENKKNSTKKGIGFNTALEESKKEKVVITDQDLIKAGMPPEFLGRIPVITSTDELELEDLVKILYKSKGGPIDEEKEFFKDLGIKVKFTNPYMKEIAKKAHQTKTGARNLRKLVRESLAVAYDDVLSGKKVKVLKFTKETALDPKNYYSE